MGNTSSSTSLEGLETLDWDAKVPDTIVQSPTHATQETELTHDSILENRSKDDTILQNRSNSVEEVESRKAGAISVPSATRTKQDPDAGFLRPRTKGRRHYANKHVIKLIDSDEDGSLRRPIMLYPDDACSSMDSTEGSSVIGTSGEDASVELASRSVSADETSTNIETTKRHTQVHYSTNSADEETLELEHYVTDSVDSESSSEIDAGEADLKFAMMYEDMFDSFVERHPHLMMNPQLLEVLRVAKLKKVLEATHDQEEQLMTAILKLEEEKKWHLSRAQDKLSRESRKKAELAVALENDFAAMESEARSIEGDLKWQIIKICQSKARSERDLYEKLARSKVDNILSLLPNVEQCRAIYEAATTRSNPLRHKDQIKEFQDLQMEIAFMNGEIAALEKKLACEMTERQPRGWIDTMLLNMDARKMRQLKTEIEESVGATIQRP